MARAEAYAGNSLKRNITYDQIMLNTAAKSLEFVSP
jgi:hypothetical protein